MKISSKIRALFNFKGEAHEITLAAAEIKNDKIFLHPEDDPKHTFMIKTKSIDILIEPNEEVDEENITIIDNKKARSKKDGESEPYFKPNSNNVRQFSLSRYLTKKKRMSILLYPEEYDMIMDNIKNHGYKKTEYFLACVKSAKKQSVDSAYKYYTKFYKEKRSEDIKKAKEAQQRDYNERQMIAQARPSAH